MSNSRMSLRNLRSDDKPHNSSKGKGIILEQPYKPGFVDDKDLETVKMAVDKELGEIANAFYQTTERTADTITRIDKIEIEGDGLLAKIEEVDRVSKENDIALAERITTVQAESEAGLAKVTNEITAVSDKLGTVEAKWGLTVEAGDVIGSIQLGATSGGESEFRVRADKFVVSNGTGGKDIPFEIVGNDTRIKSLYVNQLQSDGYSASTGWAVNRDGNAVFNQVQVRGKVEATSGTMDNVTVNSNCVVKGNLAVEAGYANNITSTNGTFTNATVTGKLNATSGEFDNVTIKENCTILGELNTDQLVGQGVSRAQVVTTANSQTMNLPVLKRNRVVMFNNVTLFVDVSPGSASYAYCDFTVNGTTLTRSVGLDIPGGDAGATARGTFSVVMDAASGVALNISMNIRTTGNPSRFGIENTGSAFILVV